MPAKSYTLIRTGKASADLVEIRDYTIRNYGAQVAKDYNALMRQAFKDIREAPSLIGSRERPEIGESVRSYHISLSKTRAGSKIKSPRHFILYFQPNESEIVVSRILHDSRDLVRHIPQADIDRATAFKEKRKPQGRTKDKGRGR
ncbi:MAG: type II toxin-antitoxin system RelE/ParE family toxin [Nitratireductor sp.]